jgi:transforming growth factor-beta-induced protein
MRHTARSSAIIAAVASLALTACAPFSLSSLKVTVNINGGVSGQAAEAEGATTDVAASPETAAAETAPAEEAGAEAALALPGVLTGTVTYLQRIALDPNAVIEVQLSDVSRMDAPATLIASQTIQAAGNQVPFAYELAYDPAQIEAKNTYAVRAAITIDDKLTWTSTTAYHVLTRDNPVTGVEIMVQPVPEAETEPVPAAAEATADAVDTLAADGRFGTLVSLIQAAGLTEILKGNGPFTILAPTDEAFTALPPAMLDLLKKDAKLLKNVLLYHVIPARVTSAEAAGANSAPTALPGAALLISAGEGGLTIDGSPVIAADIPATNGVIHALGAVILTPVPVTKRLEIDGRFTMLLKALKTAKMDTALDAGSHEFTLFAPTDEAFARLPKLAVDTILGNPALLSLTLMHHVAAGRQMAADVARASTLDTTLEDVKLPVTVDGRIVKVGDATILEVDLLVNGGVVHVIDTVLLPK